MTAPWIDWQWCSEIDPWASRILAERFPGIPNRGDMADRGDWPDGRLDLLCGGTPCQSFSDFGARRGLRDGRGGLALEFLRIARENRARWIVWENVVGVLRNSGGRDFAAFLRGLAELGYGFAWRVLDARLVTSRSHPRGIPQSRNRLFLVGHSSGCAERAASVLFDNPPRSGADPGLEGGRIAERGVRKGPPRATAVRRGENAAARCLLTTYANWTDVRSQTFVLEDEGPRGLTHVECERLMGFPDGWTDVPGIPWRARYAAIGNSWALNCSEWVFDRLREADSDE